MRPTSRFSGGRLGVSQSSASGRLQCAPDGRRAEAHREFGCGRAEVECRERYSLPTSPSDQRTGAVVIARGPRLLNNGDAKMPNEELRRFRTEERERSRSNYPDPGSVG
jgi:hypothetical protein